MPAEAAFPVNTRQTAYDQEKNEPVQAAREFHSVERAEDEPGSALARRILGGDDVG